MQKAVLSAAQAGTIDIGGDLTVNRLGFGAMRITGPGIWGEPADPEEAKAVLRRAVELGTNFIDTADSYGPEVSETLIAEALFPYPADLVIATKGGLLRTGPDQWPHDARPEHLKAACEGSLRRLRLEQIPLYHLHRPDPVVPYEESVGALVELQREGKIRHIGVSNVDMRQLDLARQSASVASVENRYNVGDRASEELIDVCERDGMAFLPWAPIHASTGDEVNAVAKRHDATARQVVLAWLLARSPVMLPIPGTGSVAHFEDNVAAASLRLDPTEIEALTHT